MILKFIVFLSIDTLIHSSSILSTPNLKEPPTRVSTFGHIGLLLSSTSSIHVGTNITVEAGTLSGFAAPGTEK